MPKDEISPKPLLAKLGVKPGARVAALGFVDMDWAEGQSFDRHLAEGVAYDMIVVKIDEAAGLRGLRPLKSSLVDRGALWIAYPRGIKAITQSQVMFSGNAEGWTDVKVCRFSETHTALKFVRRLKPTT